MLTQDELQQLERLVVQAAREELMSRFERVVAREKSDGSVITEADLQMQERLSRALGQHWPAYGFLGEEMSESEQQACLQADVEGVWVLDPLDGTANFAAGIPFFGVSLALICAGRVVAGVVHDPVRSETFSALLGQGGWLNGQPLQVPETVPALSGAMAMVDLKRLPAGLIKRLAEQPPYRSQRSFGSVALDWCWLAAGRVQVYLHGGQKLWDYAAGSLVLAEAGGIGGIYEDLQCTPNETPSLAPKVGMAAVSLPLFDAWKRWVAEVS